MRVIERLQADYTLPDDVTVLDGGTLGLDLLHVLEEADRAMVVDAVETGKEPGALVRLRNVSTVRLSFSRHHRCHAPIAGKGE